MSHRSKCSVKGCSNGLNSGLKMFCVPSKSKAYKRTQWLHNAGPKDEDLPKEARICGVSNGLIIKI